MERPMVSMSLAFKFRGIVSTIELNEYLDRRMRFALGRFEAEIKSISVTVLDANGPKGGVDKQVEILLSGPRIGQIKIEDEDEDIFVVVDRAADRAGHTVARELDRLRVMGRGTTDPAL